MKHLKKYNEAKEYSLYDSCKDVFAELLDDRLIELTDMKMSVLVVLKDEIFPKYKNGDFFNYIGMSEKLLELLKDIEVGYKRLKDEFGEIELHIYDDSHLSRTAIKISIGKDNKNKLIQKIKDIVKEYGGRLTMCDMEVDSYPVYKYQINQYYLIEVLNFNGVGVVGYNDNGDDIDSFRASYEDLEINILEEIYQILEIAIEEGLLEE